MSNAYWCYCKSCKRYSQVHESKDSMHCQGCGLITIKRKEVSYVDKTRAEWKRDFLNSYSEKLRMEFDGYLRRR